jgi:hypothetical protein
MTAALGWQIGQRLFFRLEGRIGGYLAYSGQYDQEDIPDIPNHRLIAETGWQASKSPNRLTAAIGYRF